jgi:hypothetical protein
MKKNWSLSLLLDGLHDDIQQKLEISRRSFGHPVAKGDASEQVWLELLENYLPKRYQAAKAHIVDSNGEFSDQIDVVIFDRQYSPFIFKYLEQTIIPAESVYAVFECKQSINADEVKYAQDKIQSVRKLFKTSLPIPYANGVYPAKAPISIIGGILTFESDWSPPMGDTLLKVLNSGEPSGKLDMGCVAAHGYFDVDLQKKTYDVIKGGKPATAFLLKLISQLQFSGTVPMIDVAAYSKWLTKGIN